MGAVASAPINGDTKFGCLDDSILLSMDGIAYFSAGTRGDIQFAAETLTALLAGAEASRSAVVAGGHHTLITHDDGTYLAAGLKTAAPGGN